MIQTRASDNLTRGEIKVNLASPGQGHEYMQCACLEDLRLISLPVDALETKLSSTQATSPQAEEILFVNNCGPTGQKVAHKLSDICNILRLGLPFMLSALSWKLPPRESVKVVGKKVLVYKLPLSDYLSNTVETRYCFHRRRALILERVIINTFKIAEALARYPRVKVGKAQGGEFLIAHRQPRARCISGVEKTGCWEIRSVFPPRFSWHSRAMVVVPGEICGRGRLREPENVFAGNSF